MKRTGAELTVFNSEPESQLYEFKLELEKIQEELLKYGLTPNQAKVFVFLGKYGSKTSPDVCSALGLPRTETYNVLNSLLHQGIIISEFQHPTRYSALPIDKAIFTLIQAAQENLNILSKKEFELSKIWNKIPTFTEDVDDSKSEKFQMLQGMTRIQNKMKEMVSSKPNECKLLCTDRDLARFYYSEFLDVLGSAPNDLKVIISPTKKIPRYVQSIGESRTRILPNNRVDNQCFMIKDSDEVLIFLRNNDETSKNIFAFWTNTGSLVNSMKMLFEFSWKNSLPLDYERYLEHKIQ